MQWSNIWIWKKIAIIFHYTKKTWRSCTKIRSSLQNEPSHICHVFLRQKLTDGLYCLLRKLCVFNRISRRKIWLYLISLGLTVPAHSLGYNARRISNSSIPYLYSSFLYKKEMLVCVNTWALQLLLRVSKQPNFILQ